MAGRIQWKGVPPGTLQALDRLFSIALMAVLLAAFSIGRASAYIDAGSGSYLFQMAIAGLVGALYALKLFWKNVREFFARLFGGSAERRRR